MKNFNTTNDNYKDEWLTPKYITDFFKADLDPCSPGDRRPWDTAKEHIGLPVDGLKENWGSKFVWCNPPYGKETFNWLRKCAEHNNAICLIFARTETKGFHREIFNKATSIFFFSGRLAFHHVDGDKGNTANAPSCLVAYGNFADGKLFDFSLKNNGKYLPLSHNR